VSLTPVNDDSTVFLSELSQRFFWAFLNHGIFIHVNEKFHVSDEKNPS
jgi:hypothetical protein